MPLRIAKVHLVHVVLVASVMVIGQVEAWTADVGGSSRLVVVGCVLAATASLALVRVAPDLAAVVVVGSLVVKDLARGPGELIVLLLCGVVTAFAVGLRLPKRRARLALLGLLALASLGVLLGPEEWPELAFSAIALVAPWLAGTQVRSSREHARVLEDLALLRQREAQDQSLLAASQERESIAREIHDLVGHSVSLMVLQAGAAEQVLSVRPEETRGALQAIQDTGRLTLVDLHSVLGLLRLPAPNAGQGPLPGLQFLDTLLAGFERSGLEVRCEVSGDLAAVPAGVSLTAYRITQEALTNVVRHANAAHVRILVALEHGTLSLEIADDGRGGEPADPPGHGLVGMHERVAMYGGHLTTGAGPSGGFVVRASLPVGGPP